ncbi:glucoamylase [Thelephora ganbajun]|uniref:Glucoamylase n=1 Tax=Thelephora ganbajun TaxID=370292 RepID=A0ACB6Z7V8_THEGA|nr:glucoamylase [Thelephora ganbajun]
MRSVGVLLLTAFAFACVVNAFGRTPVESYIANRQTSIDSYIANQSPIAKLGLLANIGPDGSKSSGAKAGVVIASPNTVDPNYLYSWIRDASLTFKVIAEKVVSGEDTSLRGKIDQFFESQKRLQQVSNPSGTVSTGGLAEPKFNIDETAFTGSWGRPQRDGPALRATTFILYANWLIANGNITWVTRNLWPVLKLDLDYVQNNWNRSTFDLWEEINSSSFFTTAVQHRALREGATLAQKLGQADVISGYNTQAANLLCFQQTYKNIARGYFTANTGGGRSGIDSNTILTSIHLFDPTAGCDAATFQPCSDVALSNLKVYVDSFRSIYAINNGFAANEAVATGRYPEDPWYLSTFAVAEQLYDALIVWEQQQRINVNATSLTFFRQFIPNLATGSYAASTSTYSTLVTSVKNFADGFILINAKYTPSDGSLAEQYTRANGSPLSARDLTWSYASALTAFAARDGFIPPSWGASGLTVPSSCAANPVPTVSVTFNVQATTVFGENIFLVGSVSELRNWSPDNAIPLSSASYPTWSVTVDLPGSTIVEYKYIRKNGNDVVWASDPNWRWETPASGSATLNDNWR